MALLVLGTPAKDPALGVRGGTRIALLLNHSAPSEDVETGLRLGDNFAVLLLLQTDVLLPPLLPLLRLVRRLRVTSLLKTLSVHQSHHLLTPANPHLRLPAAGEFRSIAGLRGRQVRGPSSVITLRGGSYAAAHFCLVLEVRVGGRLSQEVVFSKPIEIRMAKCLRSRESLSRRHAQQLFEEVERFRRHLAHVLLLKCV